MNALNELNSSVTRWLDVAGSVDRNINVLPSGVTFADVNCDSDVKLLIGDMGSPTNSPKLKVFKGTSLVHEIVLPEIPSGVVSFSCNETVPRNPPAVAVSMCSIIYIYKNMKLFFKFHLPAVAASSLEVEVWRKFTNQQLNDEEISDSIKKLDEIPYSNLTSQSQQLLITPPEKRVEFIKEYLDTHVQKYSTITCMNTLNMNSRENEAVACLVIGTENGDIIFLDPQTFSVIHQARVHCTKLTPTHIQTAGMYDVEFRILISTREGSICLLRRKWLEGKCLIQLSSSVVEFLIFPGDNSIIIATMDKVLQCYNKKGKKMWSLTLPHIVSTITLVQLGHLGINLIAVAMNNGLIQFYNGKNLVDSIFTQDTISVMKFGQLGQEENVLVLITVDGALIVKILKRTAKFNTNAMGGSQKSHPSYLAAQQSRPLLVPKKSKLFLEQATREREQCIEMHEIFQRELCQLRLTIAKTTLESIQNANNSLNIGSSQPLKLTAKVDGLGPVFKVHLSIENLSKDKPVINLGLVFNIDNPYYKIQTPYIEVPMVVPGMPYTFITKVTEVFTATEEHTRDESVEVNVETENVEKPPLKVILFKIGNVQPLLAASIEIPPTDPLMMPFF